MEKKKIKYELENRTATIEVEYMTYIEKINGNDFRKYYIIDFDKMSLKDAELIMGEFRHFQYKLLAYEFFNYKNCAEYPCSLFLRLKNIPDGCKKDDIIYDYDFALKEIEREDNRLIPSKVKDNKNRIIKYQNEDFYFDGKKVLFSNFNLIYGYNATGKSRLINSYADYKRVPIFQVARNIKNGDYLYNSTSRLDNLKKILEYCKGEKMPLMLDDMYWGSFDSRNMIKIIDSLYDYSFDNQVVFTAAQSEPLKLTLKRTHNPNIIDLNKNS